MNERVVPPGVRSLTAELMARGPGPARLVGSSCRACEAVTFPAQRSCPRCAGVDVAPVPLPVRGTLWSHTVQGFPPKEPYVEAGGPFRPYGVGYVDLGPVLVEARLVADDLSTLRIGLPVALVTEPLTVAATGEVVTTYAFAPDPDGPARGGPS